MNDLKFEINGLEVFIIPYAEKYIAYSPLKGVALLVNHRAIDELEHFVNLGGDKKSKFLKEFFRVLDSGQPISLTESFNYNDGDNIDFKPTLVGLALTTECNLSCVYCHANAGEKREELGFDLAKIVIDKVHQNSVELQEPFDVSYAGFGEPTLKWDLFVKCTEYVRELSANSGIKCIISTATNGVFPIKKTKYIVENLSHISLSLDGPEDIQNKHRPFPNGKGSFDIVFRNAKYFLENNFSFALRATVSDYSVNRMEEMYSFFQKEFPGIRVGFEALNPLGRGQNCSLQRPSNEDFTKNFLKVINLSSRVGGTVINSGLGRLSEIKTVFCKSLSAPSITLTPSGHLSACQRDGAPEYFYYGFLDPEKKEIIVDYEKIKKFRQMDVRAYPECQNCFCKYHCGGDCQDLRRVGVLRCEFIREISRNNLHTLLLKEQNMNATEHQMMC